MLMKLLNIQGGGCPIKPNPEECLLGEVNLKLNYLWNPDRALLVASPA